MTPNQMRNYIANNCTPNQLVYITTFIDRNAATFAEDTDYKLMLSEFKFFVRNFAVNELTRNSALAALTTIITEFANTAHTFINPYSSSSDIVAAFKEYLG